MNRHLVATLKEKIQIREGYLLLKLEPLNDFIKPGPGQFYLIRPSESFDPLLRRPFSVFDFSERDLEFFIQIKGKGTKTIGQLAAGTMLDLIGPLGRGFPPVNEPENTVIVAGGMGIASVYSVIKRNIENRGLTVIYGARTKEQLFFLEEINAVGNLIVCTDDGSLGRKATALEALEEAIKERSTNQLYVFCCGPGPMNKAVLDLLKRYSIKGYISFEERMACGVGACLGCVKETPSGMKRVCTEGPVFSVDEL
ncbi:MAG: dihydroorotate dehydrogenase electron transfer subunit [Nitrospirae bacterium]|nr:dihydroorotate dehydrogenase electron transfer subunit [Nitrospirota bacterium]